VTKSKGQWGNGGLKKDLWVRETLDEWDGGGGFLAVAVGVGLCELCLEVEDLDCQVGEQWQDLDGPKVRLVGGSRPARKELGLQEGDPLLQGAVAKVLVEVGGRSLEVAGEDWVAGAGNQL
jgi:hypothetical protein